jgi:insulysin
VENSQYLKALDIFSGFFTEPLLSPKYVKKEMNAVNSEFELERNNDMWREISLFAINSNPKSIMNGFGVGNFKTLNKPNIYEKLKNFFENNYRFVFFYFLPPFYNKKFK